jgi:ketosteroid isomerase-like protein
VGSSLTRTIAGFILLAGLVLAGCAAQARSPAADRAALDEIRRQLREAENAGDPAAYERIAAEDVVVMPPKAGLILGREASMAAMRDFFGRFRMHVDYSRSVIELRGDTAIERGMFMQTVTPKDGGQPETSKGCYLWVYRRTPGGWQQSHAIWNVD